MRVKKWPWRLKAYWFWIGRSFNRNTAATALPGDLGADVIEIAGLDVRDPRQALIKMARAMLMDELGQRNPYFKFGNRKKRAIAVDLKSEDERKIAYRLVEKSGIFVHNFRENAADRLGIGYDTLRARNSYTYSHDNSKKPSIILLFVRPFNIRFFIHFDFSSYVSI